MANPIHEANVSEGASDLHRALNSLQEELEAVDWYNQRAEATSDDALKAVLLHNRNEEIEHAVMLFEHLRRAVPEFDEQMKTYLFTSAPITAIEDGEQQEGEAPPATSGSLGIGRME